MADCAAAKNKANCPTDPVACPRRAGVPAHLKTLYEDARHAKRPPAGRTRAQNKANLQEAEAALTAVQNNGYGEKVPSVRLRKQSQFGSWSSWSPANQVKGRHGGLPLRGVPKRACGYNAAGNFELVRSSGARGYTYIRKLTLISAHR